MESLRIVFARELEKAMDKYPEVVLLTGDLGYGIFDDIRARFPNRFYNCQASEQAMTGMAVGFALCGKIPFVYSITPFLLCRPFETIRNYIHQEGVPVKLIGSGRDWDYEHDGFSHYAGDDIKIMRDIFPHIERYYPETARGFDKMIEHMIINMKPFYVNLPR